MTFNDLVKAKRYADLWILARYFYRIGEAPIIPDHVYDQLTDVLKREQYSTLKDYLERTYDDDPIPYALLQELGVKPYVPVSSEGRSELFALLNEEIIKMHMNF